MIDGVVGYCCRLCLVDRGYAVVGVVVVGVVVVMRVVSVDTCVVDVVVVYDGVGRACYDVDYDVDVVYTGCVDAVDNNADVIA